MSESLPLENEIHRSKGVIHSEKKSWFGEFFGDTVDFESVVVSGSLADINFYAARNVNILKMGRTHPSSSKSSSQPVTAEEFEDAEDTMNFESEHEVLIMNSPSKSPSKVKSAKETVSKKKQNSKANVGESEKEEDDDEEHVGMSLLGQMSAADFKTLLDNIDTQAPTFDRKRVNQRKELIDWDRVAFNKYGPKECKQIWEYMLTNARKFRIMKEVVGEFRDAINTNKKFLSTFNKCPVRPKAACSALHCYIHDMWEKKSKEWAETGEKPMNYFQVQKLGFSLFNDLPEEEKARFEELSAKANEEYKQKVQEFYNRFPGLQRAKDHFENKSRAAYSASFPGAPKTPLPPHIYFIQAKLKKLETPPSEEELPELKSKFSAKFQKLSDKKKAKWIDYAINYCQNYQNELEIYQAENPGYNPKPVKVKYLVKKSDIAIWEKYRDKPERPQNSVFNMFYEDFYQKEENINVPDEQKRRVAENAFKELDWYQREMYKMNYRMFTMQYKKDIGEYFENLPDVVKPIVLETIPRKYRPAVVDVAKFPTGGDATDDDRGGAAEDIEEDPTPKKKKGSKRKLDQTTVFDDPLSLSPSKKNNIEDVDAEEILSDVSSISKKKRKRRKDNADSLVSPDKELLITGDIIDDDQDIKIEDHFSTNSPELARERSKSPRRIIKNLKPESPEKPQFSKFSIPAKPPASKFTSEKVGQKDIDDAVRGIFDGRPHLGRRYSVYYYYSKYLCQDKMWVNYGNTFGILDTADRMVKTFVELNDKQKDVFIAQSYNFYLQKRHGIKLKGEETTYQPDETLYLFPGEPRQPVRSAAKLYEKEVEYLTRKNVFADFPKWSDLHPDIQMVFVKKLYQESQIYMKKYEEFVMNMTPNDMVEYTVFRARYWEHRYLKEHTAEASVKGFVFPLPRNEMEGEGYESTPELVDHIPGITSGYEVYRKRDMRQKLNPFAVHKPLYSASSSRIEKLRRAPDASESESEPGENEEGSDFEPMSSDDEMTQLSILNTEVKSQQRTKNRTREIRDMFTPMGIIAKKHPLKMRKRKVKGRERTLMKKACDVLADKRDKMEKSKRKVLPKKQARTLGGKKTNPKAKVLLPKLKKPRRPKKAGSKNDESDGEPNIEEYEEEAIVNEDVDCSEFIRSLQDSPSKSVYTCPASAPQEIVDYRAVAEISWSGGEEDVEQAEVVCELDENFVVTTNELLQVSNEAEAFLLVNPNDILETQNPNESVDDNDLVYTDL